MTSMIWITLTTCIPAFFIESNCEHVTYLYNLTADDVRVLPKPGTRRAPRKSVYEQGVYIHDMDYANCFCVVFIDIHLKISTYHLPLQSNR